MHYACMRRPVNRFTEPARTNAEVINRFLGEVVCFEELGEARY